jgi:hypothetical protein
VVQALSVVFDMPVAQHLVFKGGTSLSKAWKLIDRFSEDVDLAINREFLGFTGDLGKNQRDKLRKAAGAYVDEKFFPELNAAFEAKGFTDLKLALVESPESDRDRKINLYYPNVIASPGYLEPRVQLEIGSRSLMEPFTHQTFGSLIDETYPGQEFVQPAITVPTVNPERTFLEKIFLLHEEFQRPADKRRVDRLSRHLYDVVKLAKTEFAEKAFANQDLYETIVEHRYKFTRVGGINYNLHTPQDINPIPPADMIKSWKSDYNTMIEQMTYEQNPPTFDQILEEMEKIKTKFNALPWQLSKTFQYRD